MTLEALLLIITMVIIFIVTAVVPPFQQRRLLRIDKTEPIKYSGEEINAFFKSFGNNPLAGRVIIRITGERKTATALALKVLEVFRQQGSEPQLSGYKDPRRNFTPAAPEEIRYYLTKDASGVVPEAETNGNK